MIRTDLAEESAAQARYEGPGFYREHEDGVLCVRTVSYTHLDVYKRQASGMTERELVRRLCGSVTPPRIEQFGAGR